MDIQNGEISRARSLALRKKKILFSLLRRGRGELETYTGVINCDILSP